MANPQLPDHEHEHDASCAVAHGHADGGPEDKVLVAVFATPVAALLLRYAADAGYRAVLLEPDPARAQAARAFGAELVSSMDEFSPGVADVVVTDHHRDELGVALA